MPNISSETLFHFTSLENLKGILENEFYPRYSLEKLDFDDKPPAEFAYPMVCFCDIPLSQVKEEHLNHYGEYGIGMSRDWIISKKLNPVMYMRKGSSLSDWVYRLLNGSSTLKAAEDTIAREIKGGLLFILRHIKPFEGQSNRTGAKVKFYNEREWRHIPFIFGEYGKQFLARQLTKLEYENAEYLQENNSLMEKFKLGFDPTDIKYIIVKEDREILEMVRYLHTVKSPKYDEDTIKILTSRIITSEQIQKDF